MSDNSSGRRQCILHKPRSQRKTTAKINPPTAKINLPTAKLTTTKKEKKNKKNIPPARQNSRGRPEKTQAVQAKERAHSNQHTIYPSSLGGSNIRKVTRTFTSTLNVDTTTHTCETKHIHARRATQHPFTFSPTITLPVRIGGRVGNPPSKWKPCTLEEGIIRTCVRTCNSFTSFKSQHNPGCFLVTPSAW